MQKSAKPNPHTVAAGFIIGQEALTNFEFRPDRPYRCCLVCGAVYQTEEDRALINVVQRAVERHEWAISHSRTHSSTLHNRLRMSGNFALPDAALKLAAFGIFSLNDLVLSDEVSHALATAPRQPNEDAQNA